MTRIVILCRRGRHDVSPVGNYFLSLAGADDRIDGTRCVLSFFHNFQEYLELKTLLFLICAYKL